MRGSAAPGKSRPAQINAKAANPATGPPTFLPDPARLVKHFTYDGQGRLIRAQSPYPDAATWSGTTSASGKVRSERFFYDGVRRVQELYVDPVLSIDAGLDSGDSEIEQSAQAAMNQSPAPPNTGQSTGDLENTQSGLGGEEDPPGGGVGGGGGPALTGVFAYVEREHVWGPGDRGPDELLVEFDAQKNPWYVIQDEGGDVVALCDSGGSAQVPGNGTGGENGGGASLITLTGLGRVCAQWTYDAYGAVQSAADLRPHPVMRAGHKGLFCERLDGAVGLTGELSPRLVPQAHLLYNVRNRMYNPQAGRFLQPDPNATAMAIAASPAFNGRNAESLAAAFDLESHLGDGLNVYQYLGSNPWRHIDPMGLSWDPFNMVDDYIAESAANTAAFMERVIDGAQAAAYIGAVVLSQLPFPISAIAADVGADVLEGRGGIPPSLVAARKILGYVALGALAVTVSKVAFQAAKAALEYVVRYGRRALGFLLEYSTIGLAKKAWEFTKRKLRGCGCFTATTLVWTATGLLPIDQIKTGDYVLTRDEQTGAMTFEVVQATITIEEASLVEVTVRHADGHGETIQTTDEHPFWVSCARPQVGPHSDQPAQSGSLFEGGRWRRADQLQPGDELRTNTDPTIVTGVVFLSARHPVYNLTVAHHANYHVGPDGIVVHNGGACPRYRELFIGALEAAGKKLPPGHQVHHRIPQEHRALFPDGRVDSLSNWAGVPGPEHRIINGRWNTFRANNPNPSAEDVEKFAASIDMDFSALYIVP